MRVDRSSVLECVRRVSPALCAGLLLAACSGGGDGGTTEPPALKPVATVSVSLAQASIITGRTVQATASLADANGATLTGRTIQWSSSTASVATVDQGGVVTGVAPGTATVTATSEGKSGSATLTVTVDPATTATVQISDITANGQAVDVNRVAGPITVNVDQVVPPNFVGTFSLKLRDIEIVREVFPDAAPDATATADASAGARSGMRTYQVDVPVAIVSITQDNLLQVGVQWKNGLADLVATISGNVGSTPVQASTTRSLTLANPSNSLIAVMRPTGARATGNGSTTWDSGDFNLYTGVLNYDVVPAALLDRIEVLVGPAPSAYGYSNSTASVFNKVFDFTPTATPAPITITKAGLGGESPQGGSRLWIGSYRINGNLIDPQVVVPSLNGVTFDTNGDGLVDNIVAPQGVTLPTGVTRGLTLPDPTPGFPTGKWLYGTLPFRYDNKAPVVPDDAFSLKGRNTTLYQSPFDIDGRLWPINSRVAPDIDLRRLTNYTGITDGGVGFDDDDTEWYVGPFGSLPDLVTPSMRWASGTPLTLTAGRTLYGAAVFADRLRNVTSTFLRATTLNPYTTGDVIGTPITSPALFGVGSTTAGMGTLTGLLDHAHSMSTSISSSHTYKLSTTGGTGVFGQYGLTGSVLRNDNCVIGIGFALDCRKVNVPAQSAGAGAMQWRLSDILNQVPGADKQGLYKISLTGYDNIGLEYGGSYNGYQYQLLHDYVPPVWGTGSGVMQPFTEGQSISFQGMASDNVSVSQLNLRANFETFSSGAFRTGYVNAPFASTPWRSPFTNPLTSSYQANIETPLPHAIQLFSSAGTPSSPYYRLSSIDWFARDGNGTVSSNTQHLSIAGSMLPVSYTALPLDLNYTLDPVPAQNVCSERMLACSPGAIRSTLLTVRARTALALNPFIVAQFFAITAGGDVFRVCRTADFTAVFAAALWTYAYACTVDWDDYKGPPGALTLFAWLYTAQYVVAKSQFYSINVQAN